ncbi:LexA family protein [Halomonas sp. WWR20]
MSETIGDRIRKARKRMGLTQPELTAACGWDSQGRISNYERDLREPKRTDLEKLAKALDVSMEWLWSGKESTPDKRREPTEENVRPGPAFFRHVPEISWVQAGCWTEVEDFSLDLSDAPYWPCPVSCSENTFALRVEGDSMAPNFMPGTLIFIDPEVMPISGKKVVAILTDTNQATFKQYIEDGGQKMLKAMNPNWPQQYVPINGNCRIIGTVIFAGMEM